MGFASIQCLAAFCVNPKIDWKDGNRDDSVRKNIVEKRTYEKQEWVSLPEIKELNPKTNIKIGDANCSANMDSPQPLLHAVPICMDSATNNAILTARTNLWHRVWGARPFFELPLL